LQKFKKTIKIYFKSLSNIVCIVLVSDQTNSMNKLDIIYKNLMGSFISNMLYFTFQLTFTIFTIEK